MPGRNQSLVPASATAHVPTTAPHEQISKVRRPHAHENGRRRIRLLQSPLRALSLHNLRQWLRCRGGGRESRGGGAAPAAERGGGGLPAGGPHQSPARAHRRGARAGIKLPRLSIFRGAFGSPGPILRGRGTGFWRHSAAADPRRTKSSQSNCITTLASAIWPQRPNPNAATGGTERAVRSAPQCVNRAVRILNATARTIVSASSTASHSISRAGQ
jgi:hypothetical protein